MTQARTRLGDSITVRTTGFVVGYSFSRDPGHGGCVVVQDIGVLYVFRVLVRVGDTKGGDLVGVGGKIQE